MACVFNLDAGGLLTALCRVSEACSPHVIHAHGLLVCRLQVTCIALLPPAQRAYNPLSWAGVPMNWPCLRTVAGIHLGKGDRQGQQGAGPSNEHTTISMWEVSLRCSVGIIALTRPEEACACHRSAIYLTKPGASVRVRSWTPEEKHYHGFLITHDESISISEYFTVPREGDDGTHPMYVTVWCDASH